MTDAHILMQLLQKALACVRDRDYKRAVDYYESLVALSPAWEHGLAMYGLATSYESIGDYEKSESAYLRALEIGPRNWHFVSGYAEFFRDRGRAVEAFDWHLFLYRIEVDSNNRLGASKTLEILYTIGATLGLTPNAILERTKTVHG